MQAKSYTYYGTINQCNECTQYQASNMSLQYAIAPNIIIIIRYIIETIIQS